MGTAWARFWRCDVTVTATTRKAGLGRVRERRGAVDPSAGHGRRRKDGRGLRWLSRHQTMSSWSCWPRHLGRAVLVYDYRSPVNQYLRAFGSVQIDDWSYNDLDAICIRLEPANGTPVAAADAAGQMAAKANPGGYVREILLVSFHDTCSGASPLLAWRWPSRGRRRPIRRWVRANRRRGPSYWWTRRRAASSSATSTANRRLPGRVEPRCSWCWTASSASRRTLR